MRLWNSIPAVLSMALLSACATTTEHAHDSGLHTQTHADTEPDTTETFLDIRNLEWMVGAWRGEGLGGEIEEVYLPIEGGAMAGVFRLVQTDGATGEKAAAFYEFILVESIGHGVVMRLHHFSPGMKRWEDEPVQFELIRAGRNEALFREIGDDAEHSRLWYRMEGERMIAELIERGKVDKVTARFEYERVD